MYDLFETLAGGLLITIVAALAFTLLALLVDQGYGVKSEEKQIACYSKRMDAKRVSFTTNVICVPRSLDTRNDTLTVQSK